MFGRLQVQWSAAFKALNFQRIEEWKGEAGRGQGAHPYCPPMENACCRPVTALWAYRPFKHHASAFEDNSLEICVEMKARLKNSAVHGVFFRGENKGSCFSDKTMSPLEAAATRATPALMVHDGEEPSLESHAFAPSPSPAALLFIPVRQRPPLSPGSYSHFSLGKSWEKELQLGTETAAFKPLLKVREKVWLPVHYVETID